MKKYFAGLVAVCFAIVCYAFTPAVAPEGTNCNSTSTYWLEIKAGADKTCATVAISNFVEIQDPTQDGVVSAADITALLASGELEQGLPSATPFGCPDGTKVCALSFTQAQLQSVLVNGIYYIRPSNVAQYQCCIKRTTP